MSSWKCLRFCASVLIVAALFLISIFAPESTPVHAEDEIPALLVPISEVDGAAFKRADTEALLGPMGLRASPQRLNPVLLDQLMKSNEATKASLLVGKQNVVVRLVPLAAPSPESRAWTGTSVKDDRLDMTLVIRPGAVIRDGTAIRQNVVAATIDLKGVGTFGLYPLPSSTLNYMLQFDGSEAPRCMVSEAQHIAPSGGSERDVRPKEKYTFDVLVLWTPNAQKGAGGSSQIKTLIDLAVTETNKAYANSGVAHRIKLARKELIKDNESGNFEVMLRALTNKSDGRMDSAHKTRNTYKADLVSLIVEKDSSCGVAWVMKKLSSSFESHAFSVVARSCATGYYSFAHELAHNMGCCHEKKNSGPCMYPYAHGWHFNSEKYRTIMAYAPGKRVIHFSNPHVKYGGHATGKTGVAENFKTINKNAAVVAGWR